MRPLPLIVAATAAAAIVVPALIGRGAEESAPEVAKLQLDAGSGAIAYRAASVDGGVPEAEYLVVQDGKVVATAKREELPDMVTIVDLGDAKIMPGLVAADSTLTGVGGLGDHSMGAHRQAFDAYDPYRDMSDALSRGITTVYLSPDRGRLIGGRGAVVKTAGDDRVMLEQSDLRIDLTRAAQFPPDFFRPPIPPTSENPLVTSIPQAPTSRAGAMLALRSAASADPATADVPTAAFLDYLAGTGRLRIAVDTTAEALSALQLAREWGKPVTLDGLRQADMEMVAAAVGDLDVVVIIEIPLFLSPTGLPSDWKSPTAEGVSAFGSIAATCLRVGAQGSWTWLAEASASLGGSAVRGTGGALALGVADQVGHFGAGLDSDFVVYSGEASAPSVEQIFIEGESV